MIQDAIESARRILAAIDAAPVTRGRKYVPARWRCNCTTVIDGTIGKCGQGYRIWDALYRAGIYDLAELCRWLATGDPARVSLDREDMKVLAAGLVEFEKAGRV